MNAILEQLSAQFTGLIGPDAFARAKAAQAAAVAATEAAKAAAATATAPATAAAPRPAPSPATAPAPIPRLPIEITAPTAKGSDFDAVVAATQVLPAAQRLDAQGFALDAVTGVDWIAQSEMEVVYDFFHPTENLRAVVRTRVPRSAPELPSISGVFPGANWHEREARDFFGLQFSGHPSLKPLLLPEDADFHPLRKDYQP